jgi:hypothetical protein
MLTDLSWFDNVRFLFWGNNAMPPTALVQKTNGLSLVALRAWSVRIDPGATCIFCLSKSAYFHNRDSIMA